MVIVVDSKNPFLAGALSAFADVRERATAEITTAALRDAQAVVVRSETQVNAALLDGTAVQFVGTATIGTDHVDHAYLAARGIGFASAPGSNATSVAEYLAAALLESASRLGIALKGKTLGVVGVGNVGRNVVRVGQALGMRVLKNDPPVARATGDPTYVGLDDLMDADVITLHVPLTRTGEDRTVHLFDEARCARMKRGSILVNTSRGAVVAGSALERVLASGRLAAAVLDVWEGEPDVAPGLLGRVLLGTPHIAGYSFDGKVNAARMMYDAIVRHFGIGGPWPVPSVMPPPRAQTVAVGTEAGEQEAIRQAVACCYAIVEDDRRFRALAALPHEDRRAEFRRQRATYPVRREFSATEVIVPSTRRSLTQALAALGFSIHQGGEER